MEAVCTICSREKDPELTFIPAHQRYRGDHIALVRQFAREKGMPFFILSGKFGLTHEDDMVPHYDYLLTPHDVEALIPTVEAQLMGHGLRKLWLYHKPKPAWQPYLEVLVRACARSEYVGLTIMPLEDNASALHLVH